MSNEELFLLLRKYKENNLSEDESFRLQTWMNESPENKLLVTNFVKMYKLEAQYKAARLIDVPKAWTTFCRRRRNRRWRIVGYRVMAAACISGLVWMAAYFSYSAMHQETQSSENSTVLLKHGSRKAVLTLVSGEKIEVNDSIMVLNEELLSSNHPAEKTELQKAETKKEKLNNVTVPRGGDFSFVLPDGTKVWINSESSLNFPSHFSGIRIVELQGEAYFDVAKTGLPFEVRTADVTVRVLGTQFNVSAYQSEPTQTTLVRGGVEVENAQGKVVLSPGQQAEILSKNSPIEVREVNVSMYTAWVTGIFDFNNTSLEEIMTQLSRWYNVTVKFASPDICKIRFSGTILRKESLGYALEIIQKVSEVEFVKEDDSIRVEKSKKGKE